MEVDNETELEYQPYFEYIFLVEYEKLIHNSSLYYYYYCYFNHAENNKNECQYIELKYLNWFILDDSRIKFDVNK